MLFVLSRRHVDEPEERLTLSMANSGLPVHVQGPQVSELLQLSSPNANSLFLTTCKAGWTQRTLHQSAQCPKWRCKTEKISIWVWLTVFPEHWVTDTSPFISLHPWTTQFISRTVEYTTQYHGSFLLLTTICTDRYRQTEALGPCCISCTGWWCVGKWWLIHTAYVNLVSELEVQGGTQKPFSHWCRRRQSFDVNVKI